MSTPRTLVVADDHELLRDVLVDSVATAAGFKVVASVGDAQSAVVACAQFKPDVLLIDVEMPGRDTFGALFDIRAGSPDTKVLVLSAFCKDSLIELALQAKVAGYLVKTERPAQIIDALGRVARGEAVFSESVRARMTVNGHQRGEPSSAATLLASMTPRELEVLRYIGRGEDNATMASNMHLSIRTVERHVSRLMRAVQISDRTKLTALAFEIGLVG